MKKQFLKECDKCWGTGTVSISSSYEHPSHSVSDDCDQCKGEGNILDQESLDDRIDDVKDMIEGMLTRIRVTSDTLKDLSRGMFYELLPKYKHRLNIQSRALARLEVYLVTLEKY
jgi:RecJ-like exonuclease